MIFKGANKTGQSNNYRNREKPGAAGTGEDFEADRTGWGQVRGVCPAGTLPWATRTASGRVVGETEKGDVFSSFFFGGVCVFDLVLDLWNIKKEHNSFLLPALHNHLQFPSEKQLNR